MRKSNYFSQLALKAVISTLGYKGWVSKTAEELVWGYEETLFDLVSVS
jgi:hypothetical protein